MHWLAILTTLAAIAAAPGPRSMPGFLDAPKLAELCGDLDPALNDGPAICLGYVLGSVDQLLAEQARLPLHRHSICPPAKLTPAAAVQVVMRHAEWARSAADVGAAGFVKNALEQAYPCSAKRAA